MLFLRKKKIQRDREAGLVFHWRGGNSGNRGGLTLAVVLAVLLLTLGTLGFKVYLNAASPPGKYRASVAYVAKVDPSLQWLLERNSPYLKSWSRGDIDLSTVSDRIYAVIDAAGSNQTTWNDFEFEQAETQKASIYPEGAFVLPSAIYEPRAPLEPLDNQVEQSKRTWYYVLSSDDAEMRVRLPEQRAYPIVGDTLQEYWGKRLQFSVTLNEDGDVLSSLAVDWNESLEIRQIESWLNTVKFKTSKRGKGVEMMIVGVLIEEKRKVSDED